METITAKLESQYNEDMAINTTSQNEPKIEALSWPDGTTAPTYTYGDPDDDDAYMVSGSNNTKVAITIAGTDFAGKKLGTYTYKITLKDADKKAIVRTFTINYVDAAAVQAYQLKMPTEIDTTVKADTANDSAYALYAWVVETANGATIGDYQGTYDGVSQTLTGDVHKVNGTIAGNTAYVTSVEVYVQLTNTNASGTHNKVLITIPVNRTFTHVASDTL